MLLTADTVGGVWHYALELAGALERKGVRVTLAAMGPTLTAVQREQVNGLGDVDFHYLPCALEWMPDPWEDVASAGRWLLALERERAPDVVHLNQFAFGTLPFEAPVLVAAHSCVLSWWRAVHGEEAPERWTHYRSVVREGLARAALIIAPTRAMLDTLNQDYGARGRVIPNARSPGRYRRGVKEPIIFAAGRLWDAGKNIAALERAAAALPWPVLVAGCSTAPAGEPHNLRNVIALGDLDADELAHELSRASIYALPARYEPFGLSILEAALAECALVVGDIPSLREVWGRAALYVAPGDESALRRCLQRLIDDDALRRGLGRAARARALTFTPERQASAYVEAYSAAIATDRARQRTRIGTFDTTESHACAS